MITGKTSFIAHVGFPTAAFKAPMIYNPYFEQCGVDCIVVPMACRAEDYAAFLPAIFSLANIEGALITMPHKGATLALLDTVSSAAAIAGACNAVKRGADGRLVGDMFDGEGFARGVERKGQPVADTRILVVGCGGVGSAIAASLAARKPALLKLYDVNTRTSEALAMRLASHYPALTTSTGSNDPDGCDIIVNATPLGMKAGDGIPVEIARVPPGAFVGEVVMKQEKTAFLEAVLQRGCRIQVGLDMLFEQIPAYLDFFGFPVATPDELRALSNIRYE